MQKKLIIPIILTVGVAFLSTCSKLDGYTDNGSALVEKLNPTITDFRRNFFALNFDTNAVDSGFSIPEVGGTGFGRHGSRLGAGTFDNVTVYGFSDFRIFPDFADNFDTLDVLDSIVFIFDTIKSINLHASDTIQQSIIKNGAFELYPCNTENKDTLEPPTNKIGLLGVLKADTSVEGRYSARLLDSTLADSIFRSCLAYHQFFKKCTTGTKDERWAKTDSNQNPHFYIALFNSGDSLTWFWPKYDPKFPNKKPPTMVLHTHRKKIINNKDSSVAQTNALIGAPTTVATENDSVVVARCRMPISTWLSGRTAVFKLDLQQLWDTISATGFEEILSAALVFDAEPLTAYGHDTLPALSYFLSDNNITSSADLDSQSNRYASKATLKTAGSDTLVFPVDHQIVRYLSSKPRYFYFYLRIVSTNVYGTQEILWKQPRFKAVLTTIK